MNIKEMICFLFTSAITMLQDDEELKETQTHKQTNEQIKQTNKQIQTKQTQTQKQIKRKQTKQQNNIAHTHIHTHHRM
jgi:hypothetical protein